MIQGDHLEAFSPLHTHVGIYLGDGRVAEYAADGWFDAHVRIVSLAEFAQGRPVRVADRPATFAPEEIIQRMQMRFGEHAYHLMFNNCEHLVNWCRIGSSESRQVDRAIERTASAGTKVVAKGLSKLAAKSSGKLMTKSVTRIVTPWLLVADVLQFGTDFVVSRRGGDQKSAERKGQAVGCLASIGIGSIVAGPVGAAGGLALWAAGEVVGKYLTPIVSQPFKKGGSDVVL